jgi:hypothetical protein
MFHRNVSWFSTDYMMLFPRRQNSSLPFFSPSPAEEISSAAKVGSRLFCFPQASCTKRPLGARETFVMAEEEGNYDEVVCREWRRSSGRLRPSHLSLRYQLYRPEHYRCVSPATMWLYFPAVHSPLRGIPLTSATRHSEMKLPYTHNAEVQDVVGSCNTLNSLKKSGITICTTRINTKKKTEFSP